MASIPWKHLVFTGKKTLEMRNDQLPWPQAGKVLVEATRTLISTGTEMTIYLRNFGVGTHWDQWVHYPFEPGYLMAGRVAAVADGVTEFKEGDRVALRAPHSAVATKLPRDLIRIPDGVSDESAVWAGLGKIVQVGARVAAHVMGDTVVVIGLGLLGQLVVQYARLMGASEIIAVDLSAKRLEMAKAHGATVVIQSGVAEAKAEILKLTGGRGVDVVYDVTGFPPVFSIALQLARKSGTVVVLGDAGSPSEQRLGPEVITKGLRIVGSHDDLVPHYETEFVRWSAQQIYKLFMKYLQRRQVVVDDLITHRFPAERAAEAYDLLERDRMNVMGVLLEWK